MHHQTIAAGGHAGKQRIPTPIETLVAIWRDASVDVRLLGGRSGATALVGLISPLGVLTLRGDPEHAPESGAWLAGLELAPEGRAFADRFGVAPMHRRAAAQALATAHEGAIRAACAAASQCAPGRSGASAGAGDCEPRRDDGEDRRTGAAGPAPRSAPRHPQVVLHVDLDGPPGNAYAVLAHCAWAARLEGVPEAELARFDAGARSGDYHNLLATAQRWFAVTFVLDGAPYGAV